MRMSRRQVEREIGLLWQRVEDIADGLVDLDHAKAPTARLNELHTRVDVLAECVAANEADLSVLRNDYRGGAA